MGEFLCLVSTEESEHTTSWNPTFRLTVFTSECLWFVINRSHSYLFQFHTELREWVFSISKWFELDSGDVSTIVQLHSSLSLFTQQLLHVKMQNFSRLKLSLALTPSLTWISVVTWSFSGLVSVMSSVTRLSRRSLNHSWTNAKRQRYLGSLWHDSLYRLCLWHFSNPLRAT